jgi:hypothetical protein
MKMKNDMTDLSPAAQAVLDAAYALPLKNGQPSIAAALRAVADQVVPPILETEFYDPNPSLALQEAVWIRTELLAIATELEGAND